MSEPERIQVTVVEDTAIIAHIDRIAQHEGLKRSDILRRAIRHWLRSLPDGSINGSLPQMEEVEPIAA